MKQARGGFVYSTIFDADISNSAFRLYVLLTTYADKEGVCWPLNETLAEELKITERRLKQMIAELVKAGLIERIPGDNHWSSWTTRLLDRDQTSSPPRGRGSSPPRGSAATPISRTNQLNTPEENNERTTSSRERGPDMRIPYDQEMPEEGRNPKAKKEPPTPGTNPWVVYRFREVARKHGVTRFNIRHLNGLVKSLREDEGLSNEEIEIVIRVFFTRYGDVVRTKRTEIDPIRIFHQQINSGLLAQAEDLIRKHRRGDTSSVIDPEVERIMRERYASG